jgi:hypothetical protein
MAKDRGTISQELCLRKMERTLRIDVLGLRFVRSKGLCHIWKYETAKQKKDTTILKRILDELNDTLEPIKRAEWELTTDTRRLKLKKIPPGKEAVWPWNEKNGKLVRNGGGGVDWYR